MDDWENTLTLTVIGGAAAIVTFLNAVMNARRKFVWTHLLITTIVGTFMGYISSNIGKYVPLDPVLIAAMVGGWSMLVIDHAGRLIEKWFP